MFHVEPQKQPSPSPTASTSAEPKPPVVGDWITYTDHDGCEHPGIISHVAVGGVVRLVWLTHFGTWQPEVGTARGEGRGKWRSRA